MSYTNREFRSEHLSRKYTLVCTMPHPMYFNISGSQIQLDGKKDSQAKGRLMTHTQKVYTITTVCVHCNVLGRAAARCAAPKIAEAAAREGRSKRTYQNR